MPRRPDAHTAYWLDMRGALHGYPSKERMPPRAIRQEELAGRFGPDDDVRVEDLAGWKTRLEDGEHSRCILAFRDRQGFRWERNVGLNDFVSQADAAQLLGVPLMRVNRWMRNGPLKGKGRKRRGYLVIRVRDLYELALKLQLQVPHGRPLITVSRDWREEKSGS